MKRFGSNFCCNWNRSLPTKIATVVHLSTNCLLPLTLHTQCRWVQYEQTSKTMLGSMKGGKKREEGVKWVTRSTKDYMREGDATTQVASPSVISSKAARMAGYGRETYNEQLKEIQAEAERKMEYEMLMLQDSKQRRWTRTVNFFKRQGAAFMILYAIAYVSCFLALYIGFASGFIKKDAVFEYLTIFFGTYMDKDAFYGRIEAWDDKINIGFAFVINEILEVVRFPVIMLIFYQLRPLILRKHRGVRNSIFRSNAAEH